MNRLIVRESDCDAGGNVVIGGRRNAHIREILKLSAGDKFRGGFVNGPAAVATLLGMSDDGATCKVHLEEAPDEKLPAAPAVDLLLAMPRPRFFKRILPQLATLGVRKLYLCSADRVEKFYFATHLLKPENYEPLLIEGMEQAMDTRMPEIIVKRPLRNFLLDELAPQYAPSRRILAHPCGGVSPPGLIPRGDEQALVAIGAEGGWSDREVSWFEQGGFTKFSVGDRILRTDMACVAVLSLLDYLRHL